MRVKRFVVSCLLAGSLLAAFAGGAGAKEVANPHASCVGLGFSDHASSGDYQGGTVASAVRGIKAAGGTPGALISGFAGYHEGSHAACEPKFGQPRP